MLLMSVVIWYESRSGEYSPEEASAIRQEGRDLLRRAISIAPNDPVANAYMGWASIAREHDAQAAARYIQRALELDPTHLEVRWRNSAPPPVSTMPRSMTSAASSGGVRSSTARTA